MSSLLSGLLLAVLAFLLEVGGLKLSELLGPRYADRGASAKLTCNFDTENDKLYSVKWYKDENEFFRYMPDNRPQSQVFPLPGVILDESMSGIHHVVLTSLSFSSSGSYRCEVSTEAPNFATVFLNHNMTVLAYPQHEPRLEGSQESYSIGDAVAVNCTAAPSNPTPTIHWYINNHKADDYLVERSSVVRFPDDTFTASAMLKFSAQRQHFLGQTGLLILRCDVEAPPLDTISSTAEARLAGALTNEKLAQENNFHNKNLEEVIFTPGIGLLPCAGSCKNFTINGIIEHRHHLKPGDVDQPFAVGALSAGLLPLLLSVLMTVIT